MLAAGLVVAAVLAAGIPWVLSGVGPDAPAAPRADLPPAGVAVAHRLGAADELVATEHWPVRTGDAAAPAAHVGELSRAEQQFGLQLLADLRSRPNATVSPASLALALAMVEHGARGQTLRELETALHTSALGPDGQGYAWQKLTNTWTDAGQHDGFQLTSANSLWQDSSLQVQPAFLTDLDRYYGAGVWQADFAHQRQAAVAAINRWTSQHTHGRIPKLFDDLPADTRAVLANALYFKARWQMPFDPHDTHDGRFNTAHGAVTVPFMSADELISSAVTPSYTAVQLPYRGGRFAALAIMPTGASLPDFVQGLSAERLASITSGLRSQSVSLRMPKFRVSSTVQLKSALMALGVRTAFTDSADFAGMAKQPLKISEVVQRVYLSVAEKGTEAAAATGVVMVPVMGVARQVAITLDHPFVFLIRDTRTAAILFASLVDQPA